MEHIHVGLIDFFVVGGYLIVWHWGLRAAAYWARRSGHTAFSGAIGSLV